MILDLQFSDIRPCLFLELCILYSNRHPIYLVHHIWHIVLGMSHSYTHHRFEQGYKAVHKNRKLHTYSSKEMKVSNTKHVGLKLGYGQLYLSSNLAYLPSHFSHSLPIATPACLRQNIRSGWCLAIFYICQFNVAT